MKSGEYYDDVFGLADVACRKDSPTVLDNTCMPAMTIGMNLIEDGSLVFTKEGDEYSIDLVETSSISVGEENNDRIVIESTAYLSGDLLFLAYMMGKENFSSAWCNWCSLSKEEWQDDACIPVDDAKLWTVARIGVQVQKNTEAGYPPSVKKTDPKMKGVRRTPICKIPFERVIFAVLHAAIGIGNALIEYLERFIDAEIEPVSNEEVQVRAELKMIVNQLKELRRVKQVWLDSQEGGKKMNQTRRRVNLLKKKMSEADHAVFTAELGRELNARSIVLKGLVAVRDKYSKDISAKEKEETKMKNKLKDFTKARRGLEGSVYTLVDKIFRTHGADRAAYFGRKFEGIDIRKIMDEVRRVC